MTSNNNIDKMQPQGPLNPYCISNTVAENHLFSISQQQFLEELSFRHCSFDVNDRRLLKLQELNPIIKSLVLDNPQLNTDFINHLCTIGLKIHAQSSNYKKIGDIAMKILSESDNHKLNKLILENCGITEIGISHLLNSNKLFGNIIEINFSNNQLNTNAIKNLVKFKWPQIKKIDLSFNYLNDKSAQILSKAKWPFLKQLYLDSNKIGLEGLKHLVKANFKYMNKISISFNRLSAQMTQELIKTQSPYLTDLNLQCNMEQCQPILAPRGPWIRLRWINLQGNFIKQKQIEKMKSEYLTEEIQNEYESESEALEINKTSNDEIQETYSQIMKETKFSAKDSK